ncbi:MAG: aspartate kinase, partial [Alphaproteobacteria bacterium]
MARIVMKFGGTSMAGIERIRNVANRVKHEVELGNEVAVVVSAMSGETDRLIKLARSVNPQPPVREMDVLLATGEQASIALLAMALAGRGVPARSFTGGQVHILTDSAHSKARILDIDDRRLRASLGAGEVAVVAGFQGVDQDGSITTLGRGGSDTPAVALAAALKADECQ